MMELRQRMGFTGSSCSAGGAAQLTLEQCLLPGERHRLHEFQAKYATMDQAADCSKPCIVDLVQNIGFTPMGPMLPTITRHMELVDISRRHSTPRLLTSNEMYLSQGHPVMDRDLGSSIGPGHLTDKEGGMVWTQTYNTLSRTERSRLLGNGQHL